MPRDPQRDRGPTVTLVLSLHLTQAKPPAQIGERRGEIPRSRNHWGELLKMQLNRK